jgi:hypothetical protein
MRHAPLLGLLAFALAGPALAQSPYAASEAPAPKTRAEVRADLALWQRAGMDEVTRTHSHLSPAEIERRTAEYLRLRNGPQYQAELQRQNGIVTSTQAAAQ